MRRAGGSNRWHASRLPLRLTPSGAPCVVPVPCGSVDGLIVQDVGLASRLHAVAPSLPLHASTQMSVSDADGARFAARRLGARTVVLTRELSIEDIGAVAAAVPEANVEVCATTALTAIATTTAIISTATVAASPSPPPPPIAPPVTVPLASPPSPRQIFVHGHMCVSYNGQCFSSEAWGGRSANRGQCAQQCRMPYGLMVDGELREVACCGALTLATASFSLAERPFRLAAPISPHCALHPLSLATLSVCPLPVGVRWPMPRTSCSRRRTCAASSTCRA